MIWGRAVTFVNARVVASPGAAAAPTVRFTSRILSIGAPPRRGDTIVDLEGRFVIPGLVNAHDHLELNHYGRLKFRDGYCSATEWIDDMRPHLEDDPAIKAARRHPLTERLFVGALKNLLAGVTMVAHHNPYYSELRRTMPIRVLRRYGWAHSFALQDRPAGARGEPGGDIAGRWRRTAADTPFFVHLAEGIDEPSRGELPRLEALGCLAPNTVIVHGVAIDDDGLARVARAGAALVWCPSSNQFLFGRTAGVRTLLDANPPSAGVALGSDSRLTGAFDLLAELRDAEATGLASADELFSMVTAGAARVIRHRHAGALTVGAPADLVVLPGGDGDTAATALLRASRRQISLVAVGGRPLVGDPWMAPVFRARSASPRAITVDETPKLADSALARRIVGCPIAEPGVSAP